MASPPSLIGVMSGAAVAFVSSRIPSRTDLLETGAGILLIAGFALLGSSLPIML